MTNRTVYVDNNTWNHTHISLVAKMFVSPEDEAIELIRKMSVDYIFVVYGGAMSYRSDDLNKRHWMVKLASASFVFTNTAHFS